MKRTPHKSKESADSPKPSRKHLSRKSSRVEPEPMELSRPSTSKCSKVDSSLFAAAGHSKPLTSGVSESPTKFSIEKPLPQIERRKTRYQTQRTKSEADVKIPSLAPLIPLPAIPASTGLIESTRRSSSQDTPRITRSQTARSAEVRHGNVSDMFDLVKQPSPKYTRSQTAPESQTGINIKSPRRKSMWQLPGTGISTGNPTDSSSHQPQPPSPEKTVLEDAHSPGSSTASEWSHYDSDNSQMYSPQTKPALVSNIMDVVGTSTGQIGDQATQLLLSASDWGSDRAKKAKDFFSGLKLASVVDKLPHEKLNPVNVAISQQQRWSSAPRELSSSIDSSRCMSPMQTSEQPDSDRPPMTTDDDDESTVESSTRKLAKLKQRLSRLRRSQSVPPESESDIEERVRKNTALRRSERISNTRQSLRVASPSPSGVKEDATNIPKNLPQQRPRLSRSCKNLPVGGSDQPCSSAASHDFAAEIKAKDEVKDRNQRGNTTRSKLKLPAPRSTLSQSATRRKQQICTSDDSSKKVLYSSPSKELTPVLRWALEDPSTVKGQVQSSQSEAESYPSLSKKRRPKMTWSRRPRSPRPSEDVDQTIVKNPAYNKYSKCRSPSKDSPILPKISEYGEKLRSRTPRLTRNITPPQEPEPPKSARDASGYLSRDKSSETTSKSRRIIPPKIIVSPPRTADPSTGHSSSRMLSPKPCINPTAIHSAPSAEPNSLLGLLKSYLTLPPGDEKVLRAKRPRQPLEHETQSNIDFGLQQYLISASSRPIPKRRQSLQAASSRERVSSSAENPSKIKAPTPTPRVTTGQQEKQSKTRMQDKSPDRTLKDIPKYSGSTPDVCKVITVVADVHALFDQRNHTMHQPPSTAPDRLTSQRMADSSGTATSMPQIRDTLTTFFSDTQPTCQTDPANAGAAVDSMIKEDMCRTQSRDQQIEERLEAEAVENIEMSQPSDPRFPLEKIEQILPKLSAGLQSSPPKGLGIFDDFMEPTFFYGLLSSMVDIYYPRCVPNTAVGMINHFSNLLKWINCTYHVKKGSGRIKKATAFGLISSLRQKAKSLNTLLIEEKVVLSSLKGCLLLTLVGDFIHIAILQEMTLLKARLAPGKQAIWLRRISDTATLHYNSAVIQITGLSRSRMMEVSTMSVSAKRMHIEGDEVNIQVVGEWSDIDLEQPHRIAMNYPESLTAQDMAYDITQKCALRYAEYMFELTKETFHDIQYISQSLCDLKSFIKRPFADIDVETISYEHAQHIATSSEDDDPTLSSHLSGSQLSLHDFEHDERSHISAVSQMATELTDLLDDCEEQWI